MKPYLCQACYNNPYHLRETPASIQLCGFWLCRTCQEKATKTENTVMRLRALAESCIRNPYFVLWS